MNQKQKIEVAQHRHSLPRVRSASTYVLRGAALVLALCVGGLPLNVALGGESEVSALLVALEIISLLCVVIAALSQREAKQTIPRILTDEQTVHWTYRPAEWQRFSAQAWRRSIRKDLKVTGITWGLILVVALVNFTQANGTFDVSLALALSIGVAVAVGVLIFLRAVMLLVWRQRHTTADVYLHPRGFILCGWYSSLNWTVGGRKKIAYQAGDPGVLSFDVGSGRGARVLEVPVPQGREAEAEQLARRLRYSRA